MAGAYSQGLRDRVIEAISQGASGQAAALCGERKHGGELGRRWRVKSYFQDPNVR